MCRLLRDQGGLSGRKFVASTSGSEIKRATRSLGTGAIVYVDDFAGTGTQLKAARSDVREYIDGNFSEFFLLPCICEEALSIVEAEGVVAKFDRCHLKSERPLLPESTYLGRAARQRLVDHSYEIWGMGSLGFRMLATNVILSHGAPDTTPMIFRGDKGQASWFGIVPRWAETESSADSGLGELA